MEEKKTEIQSYIETLLKTIFLLFFFNNSYFGYLSFRVKIMFRTYGLLVVESIELEIN